MVDGVAGGALRGACSTCDSAADGGTDDVAASAADGAMGANGTADGGAGGAAMVLIVQRELMRSVLLTSKTVVMAAMI